MALYRTIMPIAIPDRDVIPAGVTTRLDGVSQSAIDHLIDRDAISPVSEPPLAALPHWKDRADRLARLNITKPLELVDADPAELARLLRTRRHVIEEWQAEARALVIPDGQELYVG